MLPELWELGKELLIGESRIRLLDIRGTDIELGIHTPSDVAVRFVVRTEVDKSLDLAPVT